MTTAGWLSLIGTILGAAVVWGGMKNELGNLKQSLHDLRVDFNDSTKDQGRRLGKLETAIQVQRALTGGVPVRAEREDSGGSKG